MNCNLFIFTNKGSVEIWARSSN